MKHHTKKSKRKPTNAQLDKMERVKSLLEGVNGKSNEIVVKPKTAQNEVCITYENVKMPISQVVISEHAYIRAKERLGISNNSQAKGDLKGILKKAKCIGKVTDEEGNEAILFGSGRTGIYLSTDLKVVKTVTKQQMVTFEPIKNKIQSIHEKELRKLTRKENARVKHLKELRLEGDLEQAELRLRLYRTKSKSVELACMSRIKAIEISIEQLEMEIEQIKGLKRQVSRSMIATL